MLYEGLKKRLTMYSVMTTAFIFLILSACALRWAYVEWWKHNWTKALPKLEQVIGSSTPARAAQTVRDLYEMMC